MFKWIRNLGNHPTDDEPFPDAWWDFVTRRAAFARTLGDDDRAELKTQIQRFVHDKSWEGANGLVITDEHRVVVAASAARLTLRIGIERYRKMRSIIIYPTAYRHPNRTGTILGQANRLGSVVLSWPAVLLGLSNNDDGHDTAAHEFAHVLDVEDGGFDGTPILGRREYGPWARVMSEHFLQLQDGDKRLLSVMREYGATNEAEFFAVATESFFEKPRRLKARAPEVFGLLADFYGYEPQS